MTTRPFVVNVPRKPYLASPQEQADIVIRTARKYRADFGAMPEAYTALLASLNRHKGVKAFLTAPNDIFGNHEIGTGLYVNTRKWKVEETFNLNLDWAARGERGLNFPVALVKRRVSGKRVVIVGAHIPTIYAAPKEVRERMNRQIHAYADRYDAPVVIMGDFNDGFVADEYKGYAYAGGSHVDHIFARGFEVVGHATVVISGIHNVVTDHPAMVIANLELRKKFYKASLALSRLRRRRKKS